MKKRNLNWLLALLAALALVFAGACSDGSDDGSDDGSGTEQGSGDDSSTPGSGGNQQVTSDSLVDKIVGTEWTFNKDATSSNSSEGETTLGEVTLAFGESGVVTGTASWWYYPSGGSDTAHAGTISGSYAAVEGAATQISVTLGTTTFTLTLGSGSYTEDADSGVVTITISEGSELTVGELTSASYTVSCGGGDDCGATPKCSGTPEDVDIFDGDLAGDSEITSSSSFTCTNAGSTSEET